MRYSIAGESSSRLVEIFHRFSTPVQEKNVTEFYSKHMNLWVDYRMAWL
jgi:phage terminase large subunit-like protein